MLVENIAQLQELVDRRESKLCISLPLAELIVRFHDRLKSVSSGFASLEYELIGYEPSRVKMDILVHHEGLKRCQ